MTDPTRPVVFFHIGAPKTGTTYVQSVLWKNRAALAHKGVLYPGSSARAHFLASMDLRDTSFLGHRPPGVDGSWQALVDEIRAWCVPSGRNAIIDHELFTYCTAEHIEKALADLSFADVHVLYTARDLARQLPAAWQERMKNRDTTAYSDFLARVRADSEVAGRTTGRGGGFWQLHDVPTILALWARHVGASRVHVITIPPSGSDPGALWRRFAQTVGVDPAGYDSTTEAVNDSLGAAEAAVMRRFNAALAKHDVSWRTYDNLVKQRLAARLAGRRSTKIGLPRDVYEWAVRWGRREAELLAEAGYDVVGDLAELVPPEQWTPGGDPENVPAEQLIDTAIAGMAGLVKIADVNNRRRQQRPGAESASRLAVLRSRAGDVRRVLGRRARRS